MNVEIDYTLYGSKLNTNELLNLLSEIVIVKTEEDISKKNNELKRLSKSLADSKKLVNQMKDDTQLILKRLAKEKQLSRVLSLIETLKKEGIIRGKHKAIFMKYLQDIESGKLSVSKLSDMENNLSILVPDK